MSAIVEILEPIDSFENNPSTITINLQSFFLKTKGLRCSKDFKIHVLEKLTGEECVIAKETWTRSTLLEVASDRKIADTLGRARLFSCLPSFLHYLAQHVQPLLEGKDSVADDEKCNVYYLEIEGTEVVVDLGFFHDDLASERYLQLDASVDFKEEWFAQQRIFSL